jgi:hypothetical protein
VAAISTPDRLTQNLAYVTAAQQTIQRKFADSLDQLRSQFVPWRYHVEQYNATTATVLIWNESLWGILGDTQNPPQTAFEIDTAQLAWVGGDWKLAGLAPPTAGPTPYGPASGLAGNGQRYTLDVVLNNWTPYSYGGKP